MDDRSIEAALRAGVPDEPQYRGDIAKLLRTQAGSPTNGDMTQDVVNVVELPGHRRPRWPALAGVAAAVVVLIAGLTTIAGRDTAPSATPATSTSDTPSVSVSPTTTPAELIERWVAATPAAVSTPNPLAPSFVVFSAQQVTLEHLSGGIVNDFTSQVAANGAGRLLLTLTSQMGRCAPGAAGDYRWSVSPQGTTLTLEAVNDECADRAAVLVGTWTHTDCPTRGSDCLGRLEAGRYASVNFDPFDSDSYGEVTYTVPDGWTSALDDKGRLALLPPDTTGTGVHGIYLFADVAPSATECAATPQDVVGMTAIADAIVSTPGIVATPSVGTVDGYEARTIDISVADPVCDPRPVLTSRSDAAAPWTATINAGQQMRIVLVDLPNNRTLAITIASDRDASAYAALLRTAGAVVDSFALSNGS